MTTCATPSAPAHFLTNGLDYPVDPVSSNGSWTARPLEHPARTRTSWRVNNDAMILRDYPPPKKKNLNMNKNK